MEQKSQVRVDGLYGSSTIVDANDGEEYWRYLRFRTDGTVTLVHSTGTAEDVARWVDKNRALSKGVYSVKGEAVEFWVKTEDDLLKTRFEGVINGDLLTLRMWDSANNFDLVETYTFHPTPISK